MPLCVAVVLHACVMVWLPGKAQVSVHPLIADPRLVILTLAVKPVLHEVAV